MFSLNILPGPSGILKLNLVLGNKIHEFCGWVDGHVTRELAGVFIDFFDVQSAHYLHASAAIRVNASETETSLHSVGVAVSAT